MSSKRRNSTRPSASVRGRKRQCREDTTPNLPTAATTHRPTREEVIFDHLSSVFLGARRDIWWMLFEADSNYGDVVAGTGVPWEDLLPLMVSHRLVQATVGSTVKNYAVNYHKLEEFFVAISAGDVKVQATKLQTRKSGIVYYFCVGRPTFRSPLVQQKSIEGSSRRSELKSMLMPVAGSWGDQKLRRSLGKLAVDLKATALVRRIMDQAADRGRVLDRESQNVEEVTLDVEGDPSWFFAKVQQQIEFALVLDLSRVPRLSRSGAHAILLHDRRQANERERNIVLHTAVQWGYHDPLLTNSARQRIAKAACRQVAYDYGFRNVLAVTRMPAWFGELRMALTHGDSTDPLSPSHSGKKGYMDSIDQAEPGYLHELFRHAQRVSGSLATFSELAAMMNDKSAVIGEGRPTISISRRQLATWFKRQHGKERSPIEKPMLTDEHKRNRVRWALEHFSKIERTDTPIAFLDEKWFYTTNRRRRLKVLPQGESEQNAPDAVAVPKIRSRRYPVKVMYLGVVARPQDEHDFDGRVFLKRVSRPKVQGRASRNKSFSVDVLLNEALKDGSESWHLLYTDGITIDELAARVVDNYDLDEYVASRLEFSYVSHTTGGNEKRIVLNGTDSISGTRIDSNGDEQLLELDDVELFVAVQQGDVVDEDVSCDSTFMLDVIPKIGEALRKSYHWVPPEEKVFLVMDNAGGHGTDEAKSQYVEELTKFNVEIIWQVPRSPETNMLDLGIWMSIQTAVMKAHRLRRCQDHALARSVEDAWNSYLSKDAFINVHGRLKVVLRCIVDDNGGNNLVESKRGKLFRDATIIDLTNDEDTVNGGEHEADNDDNNDANILDISDDDSLGSL